MVCVERVGTECATLSASRFAPPRVQPSCQADRRIGGAGGRPRAWCEINSHVISADHVVNQRCYEESGAATSIDVVDTTMLSVAGKATRDSGRIRNKSECECTMSRDSSVASRRALHTKTPAASCPAPEREMPLRTRDCVAAPLCPVAWRAQRATPRRHAGVPELSCKRGVIVSDIAIVVARHCRGA